MRTVLLAIGAMGLLACVSGGAGAPDASPVALAPMQVDGGAFVGKDGDPAVDISGMP